MDKATNNTTLLGVPLDLGAENLGVDIGPDAFRHQKIKDKLEGVGFQVKDAGDIAVREREKIMI